MIPQLTLQQNHFLRVILSGVQDLSENEILVRKNYLNLDQLVLPAVVACIAPDLSVIESHSIDSTLVACVRFVNSYLEKRHQRFYTITDEYDNILTLLCTNQSENLEDLFIELHSKIQLNLGLDLFIGIGSIAYEYGRICISASEASEILAYKFQYADRGVINIQNIIQFRYNLSYSNDIQINRVIGCFQDGNLAKMSVRIDELIQEIRYRPNVSHTSIKRTMIELTVHILHIASSAGVDVDEVLRGEDPYRWIMMQDDTPVIKEWVLELSSKLHQKMVYQQRTSENSVIQNSCQYIGTHLSDSALGLQQISEFVHLSAPYFSQLFKKEVGIGVSNFITRSRINRAKELLKTTGLKNEDIALQLGFSRSNYFSKIFKNETGMTPNEFRRKNSQQAT